MKGYIARRNVSFKMTDVIQLTHDAIAAVTEDDWASSCRHVEEVERKNWDADIAVEAEMEKIVIQVTSSDEDTDTATVLRLFRHRISRRRMFVLTSFVLFCIVL